MYYLAPPFGCKASNLIKKSFVGINCDYSCCLNFSDNVTKSTILSYFRNFNIRIKLFICVISLQFIEKHCRNRNCIHKYNCI